VPIGKRYQITHNKTLFDLSGAQFELLNKKSIKLPKVLKGQDGWNLEQRIKGLTLKGLFHKRNGSFARTKLGSEVLKALKIKAKTSNNHF
jgi:hypothetical protein